MVAEDAVAAMARAAPGPFPDASDTPSNTNATQPPNSANQPYGRTLTMRAGSVRRPTSSQRPPTAIGKARSENRSGAVAREEAIDHCTRDTSGAARRRSSGPWFCEGSSRPAYRLLTPVLRPTRDRRDLARCRGGTAAALRNAHRPCSSSEACRMRDSRRPTEGCRGARGHERAADEKAAPERSSRGNVSEVVAKGRS